MRQERLERLATTLGMVVQGEKVRLERGDGRWLVCVGGESRALPRSSGARTEWEAIAAAEAWLAPELDLLAGDEK